MNARWRTTWCLALAVTLSLALPWATALAQAPGDPIPGTPAIIVEFDEFCNGQISLDGQHFDQLPCDFYPDPISGIVVPTFFLPVPVAVGDVLVIEPTGTLSEVLRFPDVDGSGYTPLMMLFSDVEDGADAPADVGLPTFFQSNVGMTQELGDETFDYFFWSTRRAVYFGISDYNPNG
jgi:hypothetical protein